MSRTTWIHCERCFRWHFEKIRHLEEMEKIEAEGFPYLSFDCTKRALDFAYGEHLRRMDITVCE